MGLGENGREQDLNAGENTRALAGVEYKFIMKGTIQIFYILIFHYICNINIYDIDLETRAWEFKPELESFKLGLKSLKLGH